MSWFLIEVFSEMNYHIKYFYELMISYWQKPTNGHLATVLALMYTYSLIEPPIFSSFLCLVSIKKNLLIQCSLYCSLSFPDFYQLKKVGPSKLLNIICAWLLYISTAPNTANTSNSIHVECRPSTFLKVTARFLWFLQNKSLKK